MPRLTAGQWAAARAEYESGASLNVTAERHHVSRRAVQNRAKEEGWTQEWGDGKDVGEAIRRKVAEKVTLVDAIELERRRMVRNLAVAELKKTKDLNLEVRREAYEAVTRERLKDREGFVYIVFCEHAGERWHKIGVAKDFTARLAVIQTGCPLAVQTMMFGRVLDSRNLERDLHREFSQYRVQGEWFALSDDAVANAVMLLAKQMVDDSENGPVQHVLGIE